MIYAKSGNLYDGNNTKIFKLFNGEVINKNENKINVFKFDQIDFNLNEYSTSTILVPKIQELKSKDLFICLQALYNDKILENNFDFRCEKSLQDEITRNV